MQLYILCNFCIVCIIEHSVVAVCVATEVGRALQHVTDIITFSEHCVILSNQLMYNKFCTKV